jgi:hypothetical protein
MLVFCGAACLVVWPILKYYRPHRKGQRMHWSAVRCVSAGLMIDFVWRWKWLHSQLHTRRRTCPNIPANTAYPGTNLLKTGRTTKAGMFSRPPVSTAHPLLRFLFYAQTISYGNQAARRLHSGSAFWFQFALLGWIAASRSFILATASLSTLLM